MNQTTLKKSITFSGIGLHSGKTVSCTLRPAQENTGLIFHAHTPTGTVDITPSPERISATSLATTLSKDNASISTVEHLLGALRGMGIDNLHIDIEGKEIPILDGSSSVFVEKIEEAGIQVQKAARRALKVTSRFEVRENDNKFIIAEPYDSFVIDYTIDFPHSSIGRQQKTIEISPFTFAQVAKARTFGFLKDVEMLRSHGLALGGGLENAIVLDENGVLNEEGLRYTDEFVRHKILDLIGDLAVLPLPLLGKFTVSCSGHALNNEFAKAILSSGKLVQTTVRENLSPVNPTYTTRTPSLALHALAG